MMHKLMHPHYTVWENANSLLFNIMKEARIFFFGKKNDYKLS